MKLVPDIKMYTLNDENKLYKKVDYDFTDLIKYANQNIVAQSTNSYVIDDKNIKNFKSVEYVKNNIFAELEIQTGWCFGSGRKMNGVEWHKTSEVVIACTSCVLILGDYNDIKNDVYDSKNAIALYLEKGEAVELLSYTLHLAPLAINDNFIATILLPKGTNGQLKNGIKGSLRAVNKWLLCHEENKIGIKNGGKVGVVGDNIELIK